MAHRRRRGSGFSGSWYTFPKEETIMKRAAMYAFPFLAAALAAAGPASAAVRTEKVEYRQGETVLKGYMAFNDSEKGKRPGIVVFPEWWGANDYAKRRAEQLAKLGYVALAADLYGNGTVTTDPKQAGKLAGALKNDRKLLRERAGAAFRVLAEDRRVDRERIAAIGYCFGGTTALELARSGAPLRGFVSFHGNLETPEPSRPGGIAGKVLVLQGADDPMVPAAEVAAFQDEMRKSGTDWQMNFYGGAVHAFTNPDAGKAGIRGVAYNESGDRRSWEAMWLFFREIFGE
jgi:dienelactone hydrolase